MVWNKNEMSEPIQQHWRKPPIASLFVWICVCCIQMCRMRASLVERNIKIVLICINGLSRVKSGPVQRMEQRSKANKQAKERILSMCDEKKTTTAKPFSIYTHLPIKLFCHAFLPSFGDNIRRQGVFAIVLARNKCVRLNSVALLSEVTRVRGRMNVLCAERQRADGMECVEKNGVSVRKSAFLVVEAMTSFSQKCSNRRAWLSQRATLSKRTTFAICNCNYQIRLRFIIVHDFTW